MANDIVATSRQNMEHDADFKSDVRVLLTRIDERQLSAAKELESLKTSVEKQLANLQREADHRHNNMKMSLEGVMESMKKFVPRHEIEDMVKNSREHADTHRAVVIERVKQLEDHNLWMRRSITGLLLGGIPTIIITVASLLWKMGTH